MKRQLHVGRGISLPLDNWMPLATVVYGARGSGKTMFGRVVAEEVTAARQRFCAIDLKGDWYGLKSSADGKSDGIPAVVFGGDHADVPLEEGAGAQVAEIVVSLDQSCILDLEHLSKTKQRRFLADFFEVLYEKNRKPLLMLLDEAQRYAPQLAGRGMDPNIQRCLGAVEDLVKLGRKHGIGLVLFTQRGSGLNKEVSELCDMLVAFRTPGPLDQDRIETWLNANVTNAKRDEVMALLAELPTGTAVFASGHPDLKIFGAFGVRMGVTFDSSATPKIGHRRIEPKKMAEVDLSALRERMAEAIERKKSEDPKALLKLIKERDARIHELERQSSASSEDLKAQVERLRAALEKKPKRVEVPVVLARDLLMINSLSDKLDSIMLKAVAAAEPVLEKLKAAVGGVLLALSDAERVARVVAEGELAAAKAAQAARAPAPAPVVRADPAPGARQRQAVDGILAAQDAKASAAIYGNGAAVSKGAMRQVMVALANRPHGLTNTQIAVRARVSTKSSTYGNNLTKMRNNGWVSEAGPVKRITEAGLAALGEYEQEPTGAESREYWLNELGRDAAGGKVFRAILEAYPDSITSAEIGELTGVSTASSTFGNNMTKLRNLELVITSNGRHRASEELFDQG